MASKPISASPERETESEVPPPLNAVELEVIDFFVNAVKLLGIPKSIGEIYGLLFVSPDPLALDELVARLQMSKGSASQGLRSLRNLGAVRSVYVAGDRRDHYEAVAELKPLASGFMKEQLQPHLENGEQRLAHLRQLAAEAAAGEDHVRGAFYQDRVERLGKWKRKARRLLPLVQRFLS